MCTLTNVLGFTATRSQDEPLASGAYVGAVVGRDEIGKGVVGRAYIGGGATFQVNSDGDRLEGKHLRGWYEG